MKKSLFAIIMTFTMLMGSTFCVTPVVLAENIENVTEEQSSQPEANSLWGYESFSCNGKEGVCLTAYNGTKTDIYIPGQIDGKPVLKLGDGIFKDKTDINSVTLGSGIEIIGESAFENSTDLVCIVTPESLVEIGENAFSGCSSFNSVVLYDTVTNIGKNAFEGCDKLVIYTNKGTLSYIYAINNGINVEIIDIERDPLIVTENDIKYYIANGEAVLIKCPTSKSGKIVIPSTIKGIPVVQIGEDAFWGCSKMTSVVFPDSIKCISEYAFYKCSALTNVKLPKNLVTLQNYAFNNCTALESIEFPESLTVINDSVFGSCQALCEIEIPKTVKEVGKGSFSVCSNLKKVTIHGVKSFDDASFLGCNAITQVWFDSAEELCNMEYKKYNSAPWASRGIDAGVYGTVDTYTDIYISGEKITHLEVPSTVKKIKPYAFAYCGNLEEITLPEGIESIDERAFYGCVNLSTIVIPSTVKTIGEYAFSGTSNLASITIKEGLESIGANAFGFSGLKSVVLPESLVEIGANTFTNCSKLVSANVPSKITELPQCVFDNCKALKNVQLHEGLKKLDGFYNVGLTSIDIPSSVTYIAINAVYPKTIVWNVGSNVYAYAVALKNDFPCTAEGITETTINNITYCVGDYAVVAKCNETLSGAVNIPETVNGKTVKQIADKAFCQCGKITSIVLPSTVEVLGIYTFAYCASLQSVILPEKLESIETGTFYNCPKLTSIAIPQTVSAIKGNAFGSCNNLKKVYISDFDAWCEIEFPSNPLNYGGELILNGEPVTEIFFDKEEVKPYAFIGCTSIRKVILSDNVKRIGKGAFQYCTALNEVELGENVESIDNGAFGRCASKANPLQITFNNKLKTIGGGTFSGSYIENVVFNEGLETIGEQAFAECSILKSVSFPKSLVSFGNSCFMRCTSIESITIPEKITEISPWAFSDCSNLSEVKLPDRLSAIGDFAFIGTAIENVIIPKNTKDFGMSLFNDKTVYLVYIDSPALSQAIQSGWKYSVLKSGKNPEINYGTGISGTVVYTDGTAVQNASVSIYYDDGTLKETVTTDTNGSYSFTYAEVGTYTICVTDTDGQSGSTQVSVKRMNAFDVFLAGETSIIVKNSYTVSGTSPAGSSITLTDRNGRTAAVTQTDSNGAFEFTNVANGEYIIKAENDIGSCVKEITVYNTNLDVGILEIGENEKFASIVGTVSIEGREQDHYKRSWVQVTLYNSEGVAVAQTKTDKNGAYSFSKLPLDEYSIVAEVSELRSDTAHGYDRSYTLTGYVYVNAEEAKEYTADEIILTEENSNTCEISGTVYSGKTPVASEIILKNVFRHEIARTQSGSNGKYTFKNVRDGLYFIFAATQNNGMGFTVVVVRHGKVYGNTDISVYKPEKIKEHENAMNNIPHCENREEATQYREQIRQEKKFYDSLSEKEKMHFSPEYIERLNRLCEWCGDCKYNKNGGKITNGGMILSEDEFGDDNTQIEIVLTVTEREEHKISPDGIKTEEDFIQQSINEAMYGREPVKYYDISLTKNGTKITDISKQTNSTGKIRITLEIPEEYRGHNNYSFVHIHNGIPTTLVDLDDDPNTITFEIDKFSEFALTYSDEELTSEPTDSEITKNITYQDGKITVTAEKDATLYIATYNGETFKSVELHKITANTPQSFDFNENQKAFLWDEELKPLCEKFELNSHN